MQHSKQPPPSNLTHAAHDEDEDEEEHIGLLHQHHDSSSSDTSSTASTPEKQHPQPQDTVQVKVSWLRKIVVVLLLAWTIGFTVHSFLVPHVYPDDESSSPSATSQVSLGPEVESSEWVGLVGSTAKGEGDGWVPRASAVRRERGKWNRRRREGD